MKRNIYITIPLALSTLLLFGCGPNLSTESFKGGFECLKAARVLDHSKAADNILEFMSNKPYASDQSDGNRSYTKSIMQEVNSKYDELYAGAQDIPYALKVYNSDECITMHQLGKLTLSDLFPLE